MDETFRAWRLFLAALLLSGFAPSCSCNAGGDNAIANNTANADAGDSQCDSCRADQRCVDRADGSKVCECPPGSSESDGACAADKACGATTCNSHGDCDDSGGSPVCACELGWAGIFCGECDELNGYMPDGVGGCTDDPCSTVECPGRACRIIDGEPTCACPAGEHDDGMGGCAPDTTCLPTSCNDQGTCDDSGGSVVCTCATGWAPPNCGACDDAAGYHDDGGGGCTMDACLPNPCLDPNRSVCVDNQGSFACLCDPGFHEEAGVCIADTTCIAGTSCDGHGTCDDSTGNVVCTCDPGYTSATCAACDTVGGWHDDGAGGCTMDPCLPNPCTMVANKAMCVASGGGFTCQCDAGYHDDGAGGCSTDPCLPNPCAAMNQACRDNMGMAECFTPDCDDSNPCTDDTRVNGACQNTPVANGTSCATDACTVGETCTAGTCGGGSARLCDDANPCTDDACDTSTGCVFTNDDTNVPDDGVSCTTDTCSSGFESHTNDDTACDDGQFCTGDGVCAPTDPGADASGCIATNVPTPPPNPSPCETYGACDEATDSFPLVTKNAGDSCNDGIWCTSNDVCDASGNCAGTGVCTGGTGVGTCTTTTPFPASIDVPVGSVTTNITVNGAPLAATGNDATYDNIYAVARDTGTRHPLAYWYWASNALQGPQFGDRLVPGLYDILFVRGTTSSSESYVYRTDSSDILPNAVRVLQSDVYIYGGNNVLDVDIPVADVNLTVTVDGLPLAATGNDSTYNNLYAVSKETGTRHPLAYWYWASNALQGPQYGERLVAGTYDIVFVRGTTSSSESYVYRTDSNDMLPNAVRVLQKDVVFAPGQNDITIDIPTSTVTTNVTVNGAALAATGNDGTYDNIYAVSKSGTRHPLAYWYWASNALQGPQYGERLIAGTYDIVFVRGTTSSSESYVYRTDSSDLLPNGVIVLQRDVVVPEGASTIDVDIPVSTLTVDVTVDGAALSATGNDGTYNNLYAVSNTGTRHPLAYWYWASNALQGPQYGERVVAGTYDIVFVRGTTSSSENYVYRTDSSDLLPNGVIVLQRDVQFGPGPDSIAIDIPISTLTTTVTAGGQPLAPSGNDSTYNNIYAVSKSGTRHPLAYWYWASNTLQGPQYGERLVAGTYDILYSRGTTSSSEKYVYRTDSSDMLPNGVVVLQRDVVVGAGARAIMVDIPISPMSFDVTLAGQPLPAMGNDSTYNNLYAVSRTTGTRHPLAYWYWASNALQGPQYGESLVSGEYDILFVRGTTSSSESYVYRTDSSDMIPNAVKYVAACVEAP